MKATSITGVRVRLTGTDGNAFALLGKVKQAMQRAGVPDRILRKFLDEAMAGDYDRLLRTCMKYCDVE